MRLNVRTLVGTFAVLLGALWAGPSAAKECDVTTAKQECCSAKKCGGKVLSNRDEHNCQDKTKGKSWHPAAKNGQPAPCRDI